MKGGVLAYVMIIIITVMALVNFFMPFFTDYKTDPWITYWFLVLASSIAGYKGLSNLILEKIFNKPMQEDRKETD